MTTANPAGAASRMAAFGTHPITPNLCLVYVREAILQSTPLGLHAATAWDSWEQNTEKHALPAPRDYPIYFHFGVDGDVAVSDGAGGVYGTHGTTIVHQTIAQREAQLGGSVAGWSSNILGVELVVPASPPPPPPAPPVAGAPRAVVRFVRFKSGEIAGLYTDGTYTGFPSLDAYHVAGSPKFTQLSV